MDLVIHRCGKVKLKAARENLGMGTIVGSRFIQVVGVGEEATHTRHYAWFLTLGTARS